MKINVNILGHMTKMAAILIYDKKSLKNRLFQNQLSNGF